MRIFRLLRIAVLGAGLALQLTASAHAERRVALVIGNNAYRNVTALKNPVNDANLIAGALNIGVGILSLPSIGILFMTAGALLLSAGAKRRGRTLSPRPPSPSGPFQSE